jgi:uncharacterized damage-inducible protein DinB
MTNQNLIETSQRNHWALKTNLQNLTADLVQAGEDGTHANWVLGHLLHSRYWLFKTLNVSTPEEASTIATAYQRGTTASNAVVFSLSYLSQAFEKSQAQLEQLLPDVDLTTPQEGRHATLGEFITFILWHETYHVGQLGIFRRLSGLEGAI